MFFTGRLSSLTMICSSTSTSPIIFSAGYNLKRKRFFKYSGYILLFGFSVRCLFLVLVVMSLSLSLMHYCACLHSRHDLTSNHHESELCSHQVWRKLSARL